jgi:hypothetical protein
VCLVPFTVCCKVKLEGVRGPPTQQLNLVVKYAQIGGMLGGPATEAMTSQVAGVIACFEEALGHSCSESFLGKSLAGAQVE